MLLVCLTLSLKEECSCNQVHRLKRSVSNRTAFCAKKFFI